MAEPPICRKIAMRVTEPWRPELTDEQRLIVEKTLKAAQNVGGKPSVSAVESQRRREDDLRFLDLLGIRPKEKQMKTEENEPSNC